MRLSLSALFILFPFFLLGGIFVVVGGIVCVSVICVFVGVSVGVSGIICVLFRAASSASLFNTCGGGGLHVGETYGLSLKLVKSGTT